MNEANLVKRFNWLVTGDSYLKEMPLSFSNFLVVSTADVIDAGSAPTLLVNGIGFASGETAHVLFHLPMDYDESGDRMVLKLVVDPDTNVSDFGILTTKITWRPGSAEDTTAGTAKAETSASSAALVRETFLSMSGDAHKAGDVIQRTVDFNGTVASVLAASIIYGSSFAAFNNDDRHRDMNASSTGA